MKLNYNYILFENIESLGKYTNYQNKNNYILFEILSLKENIQTIKIKNN